MSIRDTFFRSMILLASFTDGVVDQKSIFQDQSIDPTEAPVTSMKAYERMDIDDAIAANPSGKALFGDGEYSKLSLSFQAELYYLNELEKSPYFKRFENTLHHRTDEKSGEGIAFHPVTYIHPKEADNFLPPEQAQQMKEAGIVQWARHIKEAQEKARLEVQKKLGEIGEGKLEWWPENVLSVTLVNQHYPEEVRRPRGARGWQAEVVGAEKNGNLIHFECVTQAGVPQNTVFLHEFNYQSALKNRHEEFPVVELRGADKELQLFKMPDGVKMLSDRYSTPPATPSLPVSQNIVKG